MRKWGLILGIFIIAVSGTAVLSIQAQQEYDIPNWIRNTALWWGQEKISDADFINAIQYLMKEEILSVTPVETSDEPVIEKINFDKISLEISGIEEFISTSDVRQALIDSNLEFDQILDASFIIEQREKEWIETDFENITPFMQELIYNELSDQLRLHAKNYQKSFGYDMYPEIFVTNAYGVNIAQTGKTSDYKQNDEQWWEIAKQDGLNISEVHFDQSANVYSADISLRINDSQGQFLGVIKAVTNVDQIYKP